MGRPVKVQKERKRQKNHHRGEEGHGGRKKDDLRPAFTYGVSVGTRAEGDQSALSVPELYLDFFLLVCSSLNFAVDFAETSAKCCLFILEMRAELINGGDGRHPSSNGKHPPELND